MLLAACGGDPTATPPPAATATTAPAAAPTEMMEAPTATTEAMMEAPTATAGSMSSGEMDWSKIGQEVADAYAGKYKGTTVTLSHGLSGDEEAKFKATFADFEAKTGIKVDLISGGTVEALAVKVQAGTEEDIVNFPQPGRMAGFAKQGKIIDLNKVVNPAWLKENYKQGFLDTNTVVDGSGNKILGGIFER